MEPPARVIRVDSRFRTRGTTSDFAVSLPQALSFAEDCVCYVSAVSLSHTWWNVSGDMNDVLYVIESKGLPTTPNQTCRAVQLPAGYYTATSLPSMLQTALNTGSTLSPMQYACTYDPTRGTVTIRLLAGTGSDATARFRLPSTRELMDPNFTSTWLPRGTGTAVGYNRMDPDSVGELLRLPEASVSTTALETGLVNVTPIDVLYLTSNLTNWSTIGPRGEADWICRIPVDVAYGFGIHWQHSGNVYDFFEVGSMSGIQELTFKVINSFGTVVDLQGAPVSIELVFAPRPK